MGADRQRFYRQTYRVIEVGGNQITDITDDQIESWYDLKSFTLMITQYQQIGWRLLMHR